MPGGRGRKDNRGGPRTPNDPSPVAMPGAMSGRTDGGPGQFSSNQNRISQSDLSAPSQQYGERVRREAIQSGAPLPGGGNQQRGGLPPNPTAGLMGGFEERLNGPSTRPSEPITAGVPIGPGSNGQQFPDDPNMVLRALFEMTGDSIFLSLME